MTWSGITGIVDKVSQFLRVDVDVSQDETPNAKLPTIIKFVVTNTSQHQEFQTDVVFEEVQLKVGSSPNWYTEKAVNLSWGQSFSYELHCNYNEIMKIQWALEVRVSPAFLLTFHRTPSNISKNKQLPIKAYFDFLEQMNVHRWLGQIKSFSAPNQETTLAQMKSKEGILNAINKELANSGQQLQDFLPLVNFDKDRDSIIQHRNGVAEYLNKTQSEIGDLIQLLRNHNAEGFGKARDSIVTKLTSRASDLDKATEALGQKLGILTKVAKDDLISAVSPKIGPPPAIPLKEIDLHTNPNIEEAIPILEKFIRESYRDNVRSIRVIHGKGIGVLRNSVRLHLESHKLVKNIRPADNDHGGDGATEANLIDYNVDLF